MKIELKLKIPMLPNFIHIQDGKIKSDNPLVGQSIDVSDLDDETLKKIGMEWTAALITHAKTRRNNKRLLGDR